MTLDLRHGDCLEVLRTLAAESVDAIVTDPPYGLNFMGKRWDYDVPSTAIWSECLRVLKPGGHLLAFAGTRTQHRMAVRIEDAGFEIRDMIAWVYGSGFPKSLDVSKAIDKAAGAEREVVGPDPNAARRNRATPQFGGSSMNTFDPGYDGPLGRMAVTAPATDAAREWAGWGTALKPAMEPITVARKPLSGTVAETVLAHGTGALNIDGCRIATDWLAERGETWLRSGKQAATDGEWQGPGTKQAGSTVADRVNSLGRWPANLIHDGSEDVLAAFPDAKGAASNGRKGVAGVFDDGIGAATQRPGFADDGSAARFFYCAKASKRDRDAGNTHPTVKPTDLMRYLCRLVTPPGGVVLDPFMGSGSTGKAARLEGFGFVGIEREAEYLAIARARIEAATPEATPTGDLFGEAA